MAPHGSVGCQSKVLVNGCHLLGLAEDFRSEFTAAIDQLHCAIAPWMLLTRQQQIKGCIRMCVGRENSFQLLCRILDDRGKVLIEFFPDDWRDNQLHCASAAADQAKEFKNG